MPVTSRITRATRKHPLLALAVDLDFAELRQVMRDCDTLPPAGAQPGLNVFEADSELADSVVRLLRLLDTPKHKKPLAPLLRREILYRLLSGPSGSRLLEISRRDSPSNRVAKALDWLRSILRRASWWRNWSTRRHEPVFLPPPLQGRYRHDAHPVSEAPTPSRSPANPAGGFTRRR